MEPLRPIILDEERNQLIQVGLKRPRAQRRRTGDALANLPHGTAHALAAARHQLTFFDEPYLGLDAVARQIFYDRLVEDYSRHPRTIVLSSHLIDEVANLLEHVLLIDHGRIILDDDAENIRGSAATVTGEESKVAEFTAGRKVLHQDRLGSLASVTLEARLGAADRAKAADLGLELSPVSLQQLVVRKTMTAPAGSAGVEAPAATDPSELEVAP